MNLIIEAIKALTNSDKCSIQCEGELKKENLSINWLDEEIPKPSLDDVWNKYLELLNEQNTPIEQAKKIIIDRYKNHTLKGLDYFEGLRAELVLSFQNNERTMEQVIQIEQKLDHVKSKVLTGDWMSALSILNSTTAEGSYTEEIKLRVKQDIEKYIQENY